MLGGDKESLLLTKQRHQDGRRLGDIRPVLVTIAALVVITSLSCLGYI